ncbi:MAG: hypothetical protein WBO49_03830 [Candidatus Saccharimonas sp.]
MVDENNAIAGLDDVFFSATATNHYLGYNGSTAKWNNIPLTGKVALATGGGVETLNALGSGSGTRAINLANGNVVSATLTGNTTFTFSGATASTACSFGLYLTQDGTGNRTVTWPASVKWAGGTAPTLSTGASNVDVLVFETINGGTTWFGSLVGTNFS